MKVLRSRLIIIGNNNGTHTTSGLTSLSSQARLASVGVYARGKFCRNFKVYLSSELLRSPARQPMLRNPCGLPTVRCKRARAQQDNEVGKLGLKRNINSPKGQKIN